MNRLLPWLLPLALLLGTGALGPARAAGEGFDVTGKYALVESPQPTQTGDKVEVVDVFWYGCPHCYHFLPYLERYAQGKPGYVAIRHMPAIFNDTWRFHARVYYAAKLLGVEENLHRAIFEEIHARHDPLANRASVLAFFAGRGVDRTKFAEALDSFTVDREVRRAEAMQEKYGVQGTPTVIVNGKYRVTGGLAGSYANLIEVVEVLTEKEHRAMTAE